MPSVWAGIAELGGEIPEKYKTEADVGVDKEDEEFVSRAGYESEEEKKMRLYMEGLPKEEPTEAEEKSIQEYYHNLAQSQLDAINKMYAGMITKEEVAGEERLGQTRAMGARAGLLGSPMGATQMTRTKELTTESIAAIQAEQNYKIQTILGRVDERSEEEVRRRRDESQANAEKYMDYLKANLEENKEDYAGLAESGVTLARLKANRDYYKQATEEVGMSEMEFDFWYESKMPKAERADFSEYQYRGKNGNVWIKKISFDPETGKKTEYEYDIGIPYDVEEEIQTFDGVPYKAVKDADGNITSYQRIPGVEGEIDTETAYRAGMLADKTDGMSYDEAVSSYGAVLSLDYIERVYGKGKYKTTRKEEYEEEFYEDLESWENLVKDQPDLYFRVGKKFYEKKVNWIGKRVEDTSDKYLKFEAS